MFIEALWSLVKEFHSIVALNKIEFLTKFDLGVGKAKVNFLLKLYA